MTAPRRDALERAIERFNHHPHGWYAIECLRYEESRMKRLAEHADEPGLGPERLRVAAGCRLAAAVLRATARPKVRRG